MDRRVVDSLDPFTGEKKENSLDDRLIGSPLNPRQQGAHSFL